jgi:hypothetical protein
MANTPRLGIPYPIGTDRVSDGDNAIQGVAVFLDGTAWTLPALGAGWTTGAPGTGDIRYRKDGVGNVHIQGALMQTSAGAPAFTLPVDHRPGAAVISGVSGTLTAGTPIAGWLINAGALTVGSLNVQYLLNIVFCAVPRT